MSNYSTWLTTALCAFTVLTSKCRHGYGLEIRVARIFQVAGGPKRRYGNTEPGGFPDMPLPLNTDLRSRVLALQIHMNVHEAAGGLRAK